MSGRKTRKERSKSKSKRSGVEIQQKGSSCVLAPLLSSCPPNPQSCTSSSCTVAQEPGRSSTRTQHPTTMCMLAPPTLCAPPSLGSNFTPARPFCFFHPSRPHSIRPPPPLPHPHLSLPKAADHRLRAASDQSPLLLVPALRPKPQTLLIPPSPCQDHSFFPLCTNKHSQVGHTWG